MAEGTYWSGVGGSAEFTPDETGVAIEVNNIDWGKDESNRLAEVTNAQSGGNSKWIASVNDQDGTIQIVWDSEAEPASVGLIPGALGSLTEYLGDSGKGKTQDVIIGKISHKVNTQNGAIMYTLTYKGNGPVTTF